MLIILRILKVLKIGSKLALGLTCLLWVGEQVGATTLSHQIPELRHVTETGHIATVLMIWTLVTLVTLWLAAKNLHYASLFIQKISRELHQLLRSN